MGDEKRWHHCNWLFKSILRPYQDLKYSFDICLKGDHAIRVVFLSYPQDCTESFAFVAWRWRVKWIVTRVDRKISRLKLHRMSKCLQTKWSGEDQKGEKHLSGRWCCSLDCSHCVLLYDQCVSVRSHALFTLLLIIKILEWPMLISEIGLQLWDILTCFDVADHIRVFGLRIVANKMISFIRISSIIRVFNCLKYPYRTKFRSLCRFTP